MIKKGFKVATGVFVAVGVVFTMCVIVGCLMSEVAKIEEEDYDDDFDYVDPQLDDDDDDDDVPEDDGK